MKIYTNYLLKQLLKYCLVLCTVFTAIVWVVHTSQLMQLIVNKGITIYDFFKLAMYLLPYLNFTILPLGTLAASTIALSKLYANNELLVLQTSGIGKIRIALPFMLFGIFMTIIAYCSSFYIMPKSYKKFKDLYFLLQNNYISAFLIENSFSSQIPGITIYVGNKIGTNAFSNIMIYDAREKQNAATITARYGEFNIDGNVINLSVKDGTSQHKNSTNNKTSMISFDLYSMEIELSKQKLHKSQEPSEFFVQDIIKSNDLGVDSSMLKAHAHQRITWPIFCIVFPILSCTISLYRHCNREHHWRRTVFIIIYSIILVGCAILFNNITLSHPSLFWLVYLNVIAPISICALLFIKEIFQAFSASR